MANHKRPPVPAIIAVVVLLAAAGGWYWWQGTQSPGTAVPSVAGSVEARQYQVAAALAGRITKVAVAEGDQVTAGQVLVQLDAKALTLQLSQAKEGVKAANAAVTNAKDDGTKADVTAAKARLAQAKAAVKLAEVQLGYATVKAPHAGRVVTVSTNAGQNASPGKTLLTLLDPADLFVRVFVAETRIGQVALGAAATVTTDSLTTSFPGTVTFIASQAEFTPNNVETREQRTKLVYEVRVSIKDSSGALRAGLPVDVTFS